MGDGPAPRYVVTGPTGWIGSALLAHLAARLGPGWRDRVTLFASSARGHRAPDGRGVELRALETIAPADIDGAILIHLAYLTKEKVETLGERAFTDRNLAIDDAVLKACAGARPAGIFVASSGAAALAESGQDRHPYGLTKLRQEDRFLEFAARAGVPTIVGRIFNLSGRYINKHESYAISSMLMQAGNSRRIAISAPMPVFRSFLLVSDLCGLVTTALECGIPRSRAVDLCGAEVLEMADLADAVAALVGGEVAIERPAVDLRRPSVYLGDFTQTRVLAMETGVPLVGFSDQLVETALGLGIDIAASHSQLCLTD